MIKRNFRIGFLTSKEGIVVEDIIRKIQRNNLSSHYAAAIICNKKEAGIYERAKKLGVKVFHSAETKEQLKIFKQMQVDIVLSIDYTQKIEKPMLDYFAKKIWNLHPADPLKYGGKGMYGLAPHKAVIEAGEKFTYPTIQIVSEEYDKGEILNQETVEVLKNDTPEILQKRIIKIECKLVEDTLRKFLRHKLPDEVYN